MSTVTTRSDKNTVVKAATKEKEVKITRNFDIGDEVLARWHDGLYYLAIVQLVDKDNLKCCVTYEDSSDGWVSFKNIRTESPYGDIHCTMCRNNDSVDNNAIVICDRCNHGYHQHCHVPMIENEDIKMKETWFCRTCIFSKAARTGGALKAGPEAEALLAVKQVLPYDINSLQWDGRHNTNKEDTYCYCGGPGIYYYKMLQCFDCKQWFHEACLQCLDYPLLLGDRFYYFSCVLCNKGKEYLKRLQLKWLELALLVFYNLTLKCNKKRITEDEIVKFVHENWEMLQMGQLKTKTPEDCVEKIVEIVKDKKKRFRRNMLNGVNCWSLINGAAPLPSKSVYFQEHCTRKKAESRHRSLDCNGNYLPATQSIYKTSLESQGCSPYHQMVCADSTTNTPEDRRSSPHFPSPVMLKYFLPSDSARYHLEADSTVTESRTYGVCSFPGDESKMSRKRCLPSEQDEGISEGFLDCMVDDVTSYDGAIGRIACGEMFAIHGRRVAKDGRTEYLIEWSGTTPGSN